MNIEERYAFFIRHNRSCVVPNCENLPEPHHLRGKYLGGGVGCKPSEMTCIPLCRPHHDELHTIGILTFEKRYGLDLIVELIRCLSAFIYWLDKHLELHNWEKMLNCVRMLEDLGYEVPR